MASEGAPLLLANSGWQTAGRGAVCWAALVAMGEAGYLQATARTLAAAFYIRRSIAQMPDLYVLHANQDQKRILARARRVHNSTLHGTAERRKIRFSC